MNVGIIGLGYVGLPLDFGRVTRGLEAPNLVRL
jgi:UDP-N-acetyl-D-mannosaminuronate dehydrogenase